MISKTLTIRYFASIILLATACSNLKYTITSESLKQQFLGIDSTKLSIANFRGLFGKRYFYFSNPVDPIKCTDIYNNPIELKNRHAISIRITEMNNKKTAFPFDRTFMDDSILYGYKSGVFSKDIRIPLTKIKNIEILIDRKYIYTYE
jgi:hypothetical protein